MTSLKVYYFDSTAGRAQPIKLALAIGGIAFEDVKFTFETWPKYKSMSPTGMAPFMEIDGKMYAESIPLLMYAGRIAKLVPANLSPIDQLKLEQIIAMTDSMRQSIYKVLFGIPDEKAKAEAMKTLQTETVPKILESLDATIAAKNAASSDLDISDVAVFTVVEDLLKGGFGYPATPKDQIQKHKNVYQAHEKVGKIDKIKPYLA